MSTELFKDKYLNFAKINMQKLWHSAYWDGPINGLCLVNGEKCWFDLVESWDDKNSYPEDDEDFEAPWYRRFLIWKLLPEELVEVERRHAKFVRMVGNHCDYVDGKREYFKYTDLITKETVEKYYEEAKYEKPLSLYPSEDRIIGWSEI